VRQCLRERLRPFRLDPVRHTIVNPGNYRLQFGVTNWGGGLFQSGMALAGSTVAVPAPTSLGLFGMAVMRRRRRQAAA
jgi:hypothetical protein